VNVVGASQVSGLLAANLTKFNTQLLSDTAKKMEESPEAMEVKRNQKSDFNLKERNQLTVFDKDPTSSEVIFTAYNDEIGQARADRYRIASPAERVQLDTDEKKRMGAYSSIMVRAKKTADLLGAGFLRTETLETMQPTAAGSLPVTWRKIENLPAESDADWDEYKQNVITDFGDYPDAYNMVMPALDEARNKWKEGEISREWGYRLDKLSPENQETVARIREAQDADKRGWWNPLIGSEERELWSALKEGLPEGKKAEIKKEDFPMRLAVEDPELFLNTVEKRRLEGEEERRAAAEKDIAAAEKTVEPKVAEIEQTLGDGTVGVFNADTKKFIRRK